MNLYGEFITHKVFGRGRITAHGDGFVIVLFSEPESEKKFIFPSAIGTFLKLESTEAANQFMLYTQELSQNDAAAQKDTADKLASEKAAAQKQKKAVKRAPKKPKVN